MHHFQRISRTAGRKAIGTASSGWQRSADKSWRSTCLHLQLQWHDSQDNPFDSFYGMACLQSVNLRSESMPQAQGRKRSLQVLRRGLGESCCRSGSSLGCIYPPLWVQRWVQIYGFVVEHGPKWMLFVVGHCQTCSVLMAVEFEKPPRLLQLWTSDKTVYRIPYHLQSAIERYLTKVAKIQNMTQRQRKDSSMQRLWVINRFT